MSLPAHKTKIVCTIGPASESPDVMQRMIRAGMNVARLNFSHGDFDTHGRVIEDLRAAAREAGRDIAIMADLPGPKMRIGPIADEPVELNAGDPFTLIVGKETGEAACEMGHEPFVLAKIERSRALEHLDEILAAADGIMIARGDLGVEVPIERIAVIQKQIMRKAVRTGKPVITATQMLESMTHARQPTRAEATDVANAVLDGTDCVMLSGESAVGKYPVEAVATLARIASATEPHRSRVELWEELKTLPRDREYDVRDLISLSIEATMQVARAAAVVVPTRSGATARSIARFWLPVWLVAASGDESTCRQLQFSYGVQPILHLNEDEDWDAFTRRWIRRRGVDGTLAILVQGPSPRRPEATRGERPHRNGRSAAEGRIGAKRTFAAWPICGRIPGRTQLRDHAVDPGADPPHGGRRCAGVEL